MQYIEFHITHKIAYSTTLHEISFNVILCLTMYFYSASTKQILHNTYSNFCKVEHPIFSNQLMLKFPSFRNKTLPSAPTPL